MGEEQLQNHLAQPATGWVPVRRANTAILNSDTDQADLAGKSALISLIMQWAQDPISPNPRPNSAN
jgi:hypothetical protein